MKKITLILLIVTLATGIININNSIVTLSKCTILSHNPEESAEFRNMILTEQLLNSVSKMSTDNSDYSFEEYLAVYMLANGFSGMFKENLTANALKKLIKTYNTYDKSRFKQYSNAYLSILTDLKFFPMAFSNKNPKDTFSFDNSWMFERNYGGTRGHEGTDIMPPKDRSGYYPVVSITDGIVENIGWLEKGGWRIGIRSPHGAYFYYAHLSSYMKDFKIGDTVKAGEALGYMGDTGYGPEGTTGKFANHLHIGIYISTEHFPELSVNPYWILKTLEDQRIYYNF